MSDQRLHDFHHSWQDINCRNFSGKFWPSDFNIGCWETIGQRSSWWNVSFILPHFVKVSMASLTERSKVMIVIQIDNIYVISIRLMTDIEIQFNSTQKAPLFHRNNITKTGW